ncbi:hypothetical protein FVER14953_01935 [Fusarium verticillioides]|nr:hypothetical protein FVER14953_01935 [Fusarium verticillioides]
MDGLWEALADLDCEVVEEKDGAVQDQVAANMGQHDTTDQFDEIQDSQDDVDEAFSPIHQASQLLAEKPFGSACRASAFELTPPRSLTQSIIEATYPSTELDISSILGPSTRNRSVTSEAKPS